MTDPALSEQIQSESEQVRQRALAEQELADIKELEHSAWFKSYYLRRLGMIEKSIISQITEGVPHALYDALVAQLQLLRQIMDMPASDKIGAAKNIHPQEVDSEG